jgi:hypothetical protein
MLWSMSANGHTSMFGLLYKSFYFSQGEK